MQRLTGVSTLTVPGLINGCVVSHGALSVCLPVSGGLCEVFTAVSGMMGDCWSANDERLRAVLRPRKEPSHGFSIPSEEKTIKRGRLVSQSLLPPTLSDFTSCSLELACRPSSPLLNPRADSVSITYTPFKSHHVPSCRNGL